MVSTGGGIVIAVVVILLIIAVGWVVFTQLRARRLGLPPPTLSEYLPWKRPRDSSGAPRPAPGGAVGWITDQVRKFKNRNRRSASVAYEQPLRGGPQRRGFGPLDPDEAWDARVGVEADSYGNYEERRGGGGGRGGDSSEYHGGAAGNSYAMNLAGPYDRDDEHHDEVERGRKTSRAGDGANPFDDDAEGSLRGVSPRPMEGAPRDSVDTRRSAFREDV